MQTKRSLMEKAYGSAFPMKMDIERQILSRYELVLYPCFMKSLDCLRRTVLSSGQGMHIGILQSNGFYLLCLLQFVTLT